MCSKPELSFNIIVMSPDIDILIDFDLLGVVAWGVLDGKITIESWARSKKDLSEL